MNESGQVVQQLVKKVGLRDLNNLYVVHDDLDIRLGDYKIQLDKGPKVHKGVDSVESVLGTSKFWRVRVGVDNREALNRTPGESYVLQDFSLSEKQTLDSVIAQIVNNLLKLSNQK